MDLGEGWSHVVQGGRVVNAISITSTTTPNPQPVKETPKQPDVTTTRKAAKPKKPAPKKPAPKRPAPKPAAAAEAAPAKPSKRAPVSVKTTAAKPKPNELVVNPQRPASVLEDISDLLDNLPLQACVELTRRLLTSIPFLPPGAARPRAVLKTVILFVAEYGSTP